MDPYSLDTSDPWKLDVTQKRERDIADFDALPLTYARKSARTVAPTSSTNIISTDNYGDMIALNGFLYIVVNNSGNLKWQRVTLSDF